VTTTLTATGQVIAGRYDLTRFVAGGAMGESELLATSGALDPVRVAGLIAQAAAAVHAAHLAGVVHRDLTPGNLLVCAGDVVKITDFGIARAAGLPALTAAGQVLGAAAYLSPEQVRGQPASPASDIYSLGVVLYESLTVRAAAAPPPTLTGAAAVRLAAGPAAEYPARWLAVCQRAGELRQRVSISGIGLIGAAVILLVVLSVPAASSQGGGATASDTAGPRAGTVRVGNDAGKGDG
jgi:hypothetical protein